MATYGALVQRIIDESSRGDTSITAIVSQQVLSAVDYYATDRFWFNEKQSTLTTSSSLAYYAWPTDLLETDSVVITDPGGSKRELDPISFKSLETMDNGRTFGRPQWYATYNKQYRFYPVPDATYTVGVSHQYLPATLSASTDSNCWTNEALDLIRSRALGLLHLRFKAFDIAQAYQQAEAQEYARLKAQTDKLLGIGSLEGSGF